MNNYYTYAYLREDGTPYYIGKGKKYRAYESHRHIKVPKDKNKILFLKQNLTEDESFNHEKYMIAVLGRKDLGTGILRNLTDGGEGTSGCFPSEETRKKLSESRIGEKNHNYGKPRSEETKKKIGESNRGKIISEQTKKRLSEASKKRPKISEETKLKLSNSKKGKNNSFYGKNHSKNTKEKMSNAHKGKPKSEETRKKMSESQMGVKNHMYGKPLSEEHKKKISESLRGRKDQNK
jgi:hypothetical protein